MTTEQIFEKAQKKVATTRISDFNGNGLASGRGVVISDDEMKNSNTQVFEGCEDFIVKQGDVLISNVEILGF